MTRKSHPLGPGDPPVSIIIPVYNGSNYLKEAIDSALAQTYNNVEVVVVNDGSNDNGATERVAESYGDKIRYYKKENGGVATALNFGIKKMAGKYFSWLSHDDLYEKTKIEDEVNLIRSLHADDVIVACDAYVLFENGIKKKEQIDEKTFEYFDIFLGTSADVGINGCALLIPRKALIESGGFDPSLPVTQDYDLWFRLSSKFRYRFVLLRKSLVVYRRHDMQDSVQKQGMLVEAGDKLRYEILKTIDYRRFKDYFLADKANIKHALKNYGLYKTRGHKKAASMMLKNILRYYYENDRDEFYKVYSLEIARGSGANGSEPPKPNKLTDSDRQMIDQEYSSLLRSGTDAYPIREPRDDEGRPPKTRIQRIARRLRGSIKRDGIYLTGEKIIRRIIRK